TSFIFLDKYQNTGGIKMPVTTIYEDGIITAFLMGDIDHHSAAVMREHIDHMVETSLPEKLIIDFKDVTFMDSSGIGLIMGRYKLMRSIGGDIAVTNVSSHIHKVMKLAGLDLLAVVIK
ncbi:MAG: STAS domain-containing protein, partial [Oscillospiraceae bacterium]